MKTLLASVLALINGAACAQAIDTFSVLAGTASQRGDIACGIPGRPAAASQPITAQTEWGTMLAWWCADGEWYALVKTAQPSIDASQFARLSAIAWPRLLEAKPKAPAWAVAPNGTRPDRPTSLLQGGALYPGSTRVLVGATCDCVRARHVVGATTYCAVAPWAEDKWPVVAVCRAK